MSDTLVINETIRRLAERQAAHSYEMEETVDVYWFPDETYVRLIVTDDTVDPAPDGLALAFYLPAYSEEGVKYREGMAVIRSDEFGKLQLPKGWGTWEDAIRIPERP